MLARPESDDASGQVGIIERDARPTAKRKQSLISRRESDESWAIVFTQAFSAAVFLALSHS
jgi:hypothetical protein